MALMQIVCLQYFYWNKWTQGAISVESTLLFPGMWFHLKLMNSGHRCQESVWFHLTTFVSRYTRWSQTCLESVLADVFTLYLQPLCTYLLWNRWGFRHIYKLMHLTTKRNPIPQRLFHWGWRSVYQGFLSKIDNMVVLLLSTRWKGDWWHPWFHRFFKVGSILESPPERYLQKQPHNTVCTSHDAIIIYIMNPFCSSCEIDLQSTFQP